MLVEFNVGFVLIVCGVSELEGLEAGVMVRPFLLVPMLD